MNRKAVFLITLLFAAASVGTGWAVQQRDRPTGVYTNMRVSSATGDVGGIEIFVLGSNRGYYVLVQMAEGAPMTPVLASARIRDGEILFEMARDSRLGGMGAFEGSIGGGHLRGRFGNGFAVDLQRGQSFWQ